jgi:hypothetical protein
MKNKNYEEEHNKDIKDKNEKSKEEHNDEISRNELTNILDKWHKFHAKKQTNQKFSVELEREEEEIDKKHEFQNEEDEIIFQCQEENNNSNNNNFTNEESEEDSESNNYSDQAIILGDADPEQGDNPGLHWTKKSQNSIKDTKMCTM